VVGPGDVALALAGTGAVTYLKREAGVPHVFVADLERGVPGAPQRVDLGGDAPSSGARIAVTNGGRVLVTWINDGKLWASLRPSRTAAFAAPVVAYAPATGSVRGSSLSMAVNGKAYAGIETSDGDARAAYMIADGTWSAPAPPLDVDPAQTAVDPVVAVSADGTALYAWTETGADGRTHVFARRMVGTRPYIVAPEASVAALDGRAGGNADSPSVGIEYDSARAWVAFRQEFADGSGFTSRGFGRRLLASSFDDPPVPIDGLAFGLGASATQPRIAFSGRGRGTFAASTQGPVGVTGGLLKNDVLGKLRQLGSAVNVSESFPAPTASEDNTGTVTWQRDPGPGGVRSIVGRNLTSAGAGPQGTLSVPALGAVDASTGLYASADAGGDAAITFAQGDAGARTVGVALWDAPPRQPHAHNEEHWRRDPRPRFHWSVVTDTWSTSVKYRLEIDKKPVRTFDGTPVFVLPQPIPDGDHRWRIVTIDSRGQETVSHDRFLRIDVHRPKVRVQARRAGGSSASFKVIVLDGNGSGAGRITIAFGDGTSARVPPSSGEITHRYRGGGSYSVRAVVRDKAGNVGVGATRVRVG
jgi:hypothetical protein